MPLALTRQVSPAIADCELTHLDRIPIDPDRAGAQHDQYVEALRSLGVEVTVLPADPDHPDSVFVEDAALVFDEVAVMTRPGAATRRGELVDIEAALAPHRDIVRIEAPAILDGGDVLTVGRTVWVGVSSRSSDEGVNQLRHHLAPHGYQVKATNVTGCLHLKTAVTQVGDGLLLVNPEWMSKEDFPGLRFIDVHPDEPFAANAVIVGETIIYPTAFPKTRERLEDAGIPMVLVDADELAKAEGAVTCCSLLFNSR